MEAFAQGSYVLLALIGIGFVIVVHELGHFLFAKLAKVRVTTFSIGFGRVIWSKTIGETEYCLSLLPVGGYVAFQEEEDPDAPEEERGRAFASASAGWRAAILAAGVVFNLVTSFLILLFLSWYGLPTIPPVVGDVHGRLMDQQHQVVESPASRLGLRRGDRIVAINGQETRSFRHVTLAVIDAGAESLTVTVERDGQRLVLPAGDEKVTTLYVPHLGRGTLGVEPPASTVITGVAGRNGEAIEPGWRVQAVDGTATNGLAGQQVADELLLPHLGDKVALTLSREQEHSTAVITYAGDPNSFDDSALGLPVLVSAVHEGMPAFAAGLQPGDVIRAVDGVAVAGPQHLRARIREAIDVGRPVAVAWLRRGAGGWTEHQATMPAERDAKTGLMLIGIEMRPLRRGRMPLLPPALGTENSPLAAAGLAPGDAILAWRPQPEDGTVAVDYLRGGESVLVPLDDDAWIDMRDTHEPSAIGKMLFQRARTPLMDRLVATRVVTTGGMTLTVAPHRPAEDEDGERRLDLGTIAQVAAREALLSLEPGDWIVSAHAVAADGRQAFEIVRGATAPQSAIVTPIRPGTALAFEHLRKVPYPLDGWTDGFVVAADESARIIGATFRLIPRFFRSSKEGGVDPSKSLQGPIGIFSTLRTSVEQQGVVGLLQLLAILGLNLFLINLLPLPIADGGRLVFLGLEVVMRRPLPPKVLEVINLIGVVLLVMLFVYVFGIDLLRQFGLH